MTDYVISLDSEDAANLEARASQLGYTSVTDYLRALIAADAIIETLRPDWQDAEQSAQEIEASFREAWHDALTDNVRPIDELWDAVKNDD